MTDSLSALIDNYSGLPSYTDLIKCEMRPLNEMTKHNSNLQGFFSILDKNCIDFVIILIKIFQKAVVVTLDFSRI